MDTPTHTVLRAEAPPELRGDWDGPTWHRVPALDVASFRPEGSTHRPRTRCKLLYGPEAIYGLFRVDDRYVRCVHTRFQDPVYQDSCVEFFVQPRGARGYFNFEFNCGGAMLASYVLDPTRLEGGGLKEAIPLGPEADRLVRRYHDLPAVIEPEWQEAVIWHLEWVLPFAVLAPYAGPLDPPAGQAWRANAYKCGDVTSHPHWASWAPVDALNFHLPAQFGTLHFEAGG
jgi:hypothetical protein